MKHRIAAIVTLSCLLFATRALALTYYVSTSGSDSNSGTSMSSPWKTLSKINGSSFTAGDVISFQRGGSWTGNLTIRNSGLQDKPITVTAYGSGERPIIRNPGTWTFSVTVNADWVVIGNLLLRDSNQGGVLFSSGSDHNVVRDCEFTKMGSAVEFRGQYNLATENEVHDMAMVVNTSGGDDDWGANGFNIQAPNNEISYNVIRNCLAPSYDYGYDGGVVELFGNTDNTYIHHNLTSNSDGFVEVGGRPGSAHNVRIAYNISLNNRGRFGTMQNSGTFYSDLANFRIENNTIIETVNNGGWVLFWFKSAPATGDVVFKNNIVRIDQVRYLANYDLDRSRNLYRLLNNGTQLISSGGGLKTAETFGDPKFVNLQAADVHLQSGSPAIDKGTDLGYRLDFENHAVPSGAAPDLGAHEYGGSASVPAPPKNLRTQ